jgi:hypothetical protein
MSASIPANHAGLLVPLDMFRISQLAGMFSDILVSKARNILDAKLVLCRHADAPILLMRIEGSVVGDNPADFWRENADLVAVVSRALPRQLILYYVENAGAPDRIEGFMVAQQGQMIAADEATADRLPPGATESDWPVARLCQQMRIDPADLAAGFPGGPRVEVSLVEPNVDDQALLMTLLGQESGAEGEPPQPAANPATPPAAKTGASLQEDLKRREKIRQEEEEERQRRAAEVRSGLPHAVDDLGVVVAPSAEISEAEILTRYIVAKVANDLPDGVPRDLTARLQGKRVDIVVRFDFLSEVFVDNTPLSRPRFEELAEVVSVAGKALRRLEVLGPRLGYGTMFSTGKQHVFVSRKPDMPMPEAMIAQMLA